MQTQPTPLYALTTKGEFVQVIGWHQNPSTGRVLPMVVRLASFGMPYAHTEDLAYLAEAPDVTHELNKLGVKTSQSTLDADTEFIQRVRGRVDTVPAYGPGDVNHPRY